MARNEMHELAKQMSEAISTVVEQRYIEEEAKLEEVLRANGWVKVMADDHARQVTCYTFGCQMGDQLVNSVLDTLKANLSRIPPHHFTLAEVECRIEEVRAKMIGGRRR